MTAKDLYQPNLSPNRGIAKCLYDYSIPFVKDNECRSKVIRVVLSYPDKSKKKRPGDIFYVLHAFDRLIYDHNNFKKLC